MNKKIFLLLVFLLLLVMFVFSENNSDNLRIGIILIENPGEDAGIESLCETATDTIELTLRLVNKYTVDRLDFLLPEVYLDRTELYLQNNNFDNAVFGEIKQNLDGKYIFSIKGWERSSNSIVVKAEEKSDSIFDMFDIVDNLTIEFIEKLSGEHIGFGKINFINEGAKTDYNIYVDGNLLGKNIKDSNVLFGKRTFKITVPGQFGDTVVDTVTIKVEENGEQNIVFSMGESASSLAPSGSDEISAIGNLFIDSDPAGSEVFLDNQFIGLTPLALYGVGAGLYDLRIANEYYIPETKVLRLEPNVDNTLSFDMGIDVENSYIKKHLVSPSKTVLYAGGITLLEFGMVLLKPILFGDPIDIYNLSYFDLMLVSLRPGHLLANDPLMGILLSASSYIGYEHLLKENSSDNFDHSSLLDSVVPGAGADFLAIAMFSLPLIYDFMASPMAARRSNNRFLKNFSPDNISTNEGDSLNRYFLILDTGSLDCFSIGMAHSFLWNWLNLEQLIGVSSDNYCTFINPQFSLTSKILVNPSAESINSLEPYIGPFINFKTDFESLSINYGMVSGFDIKFSRIKLFLEAEFCIVNNLDSDIVYFSTGVRL